MLTLVVSLGCGDLCDKYDGCEDPEAHTPEGMVRVPAGPFWMGCDASKESSCPEDELPRRKVMVSQFYIDLREVTVARYRACVQAGVCPVPELLHADDPAANWGAEDRDNHPINGISWKAARDFCAWDGGRLPTEAEWEKAARGGCALFPGDCAKATPVYPWGDVAPACRFGVLDLAPEGLVGQAGDLHGCEGKGTLPVGSRPQGRSPYGIDDMAGNVWEALADGYDAEAYGHLPTTDPRAKGTAACKVSRGGGFSSQGPSARASGRSYKAPHGAAANHGVRCARSGG